jgi:hypothetical protein
MGYIITQRLLPGPFNAYENGQYEGVKVYGTDMSGVTAEDFALGKAEYEEFVHYFADNQNILQVADVNSTGATDDNKYVHVGICSFTDDGVFIRSSYPQYTWLIAKILFDKELPVIENETLFLDDVIDKFQTHYGIYRGQFFTDIQTQYNRIANGQI